MKILNRVTVSCLITKIYVMFLFPPSKACVCVCYPRGLSGVMNLCSRCYSAHNSPPASSHWLSCCNTTAYRKRSARFQQQLS